MKKKLKYLVWFIVIVILFTKPMIEEKNELQSFFKGLRELKIESLDIPNNFNHYERVTLNDMASIDLIMKKLSNCKWSVKRFEKKKVSVDFPNVIYDIYWETSTQRNHVILYGKKHMSILLNDKTRYDLSVNWDGKSYEELVEIIEQEIRRY